MKISFVQTFALFLFYAGCSHKNNGKNSTVQTSFDSDKVVIEVQKKLDGTVTVDRNTIGRKNS